MSTATLSIRAHFDGKFIVPDEPVALPLDAPLHIEVRTLNNVSREISEITALAGDAAAAAKRLAHFAEFSVRLGQRSAASSIPARGFASRKYLRRRRKMNYLLDTNILPKPNPHREKAFQAEGRSASAHTEKMLINRSR
jgi:hypothetical protein